MYTEIKHCRLCGSANLELVVNLGKQALTGIFPAKDEYVPSAPLTLLRCMNHECKLVQLKHTYNLEKMYNSDYGYRSSLNSSMKEHLKTIYNKCRPLTRRDDVVLDIGANDGTLLKFYNPVVNTIAIDPTIKKFKKYYSEDIDTIEDFFPSIKLDKLLNGKKVKVITSIACFYDLENPVEFAQKVSDLLDINGVWITEQSYLPSMIKNLAYDTICHEHLEYYGLKQIQFIADKVGLKIIDVVFNDVNGGSFQVTLCKEDNTTHEINQELIDTILYFENAWNNIETFCNFEKNVILHRNALQRLFFTILKDKTVYGFGASTKGNVLLQYCGLDSSYIQAIAEVNETKFGKYTPGTNIPIIPQDQAIKENPDYFFVLPWHFKKNIVFNNPNLNFIFPLPSVTIERKTV